MATVPANVIGAAGTSSNTFTVTTVPVFASTSVTITATYSGSKTATLTVTADVSFLMNRGDEMLLASASREEEEVVPEEAQAAEEVVTAPTPKTPRENAPTFKLVSLWTLGKSAFSQLFRDRSQMDPHDGALADDLDGDVGFLSRPLWDFRLSSGTAARSSSGARTALTTTGARYFFYTPEMNLMAETELTANPTPAILYEYVWFGGQPVAQVDSAGTTSWTFTDHLGTPLIQTSSVQGITWRAEHEPYGEVFALRTADQHQPLRLPGQEAEQLNLGPNGATERSYNIFRWYRPAWGRYTQPDPIGLDGGTNLFGYSLQNPIGNSDATGLCPACSDCPSGEWTYSGGGASISLFIGGTTSFYGSYKCKGDPLRPQTQMEVPVKVKCTFGGIIFGGGAGWWGSTPLFPGGCGCNASDLLGKSEGWTASAYIFSADVGPCAGTGPATTLNIGIGRSWGAGIARTHCVVSRR